jgi:RNA polymerase sigma-70 factor, ECF subfamily
LPHPAPRGQFASAAALLRFRRGNTLRICYDRPAKQRGRAVQGDDSEPLMASRQELSDFLASVERKAFKQAMFALRNEESSLDVVQDAMLKLAEKYADKPAAELPLLFQRILANTINDFFRRQKVRNLWTTLFSSLNHDDENGDSDPLETLEAEEGSYRAESAADQVSREQILNIIDKEIQRLPRRQREAFLMRYWEDMDVAETAAAMGCSEGSVKTHCSRATHTLAQALKARGVTL